LHSLRTGTGGTARRRSSVTTGERHPLLYNAAPIDRRMTTFIGDLNIRSELADAEQVVACLDAAALLALANVVASAAAALHLRIDVPWRALGVDSRSDSDDGAFEIPRVEKAPSEATAASVATATASARRGDVLVAAPAVVVTGRRGGGDGTATAVAVRDMPADRDRLAASVDALARVSREQGAKLEGLAASVATLAAMVERLSAADPAGSRIAAASPLPSSPAIPVRAESGVRTAPWNSTVVALIAVVVMVQFILVAIMLSKA